MQFEQIQINLFYQSIDQQCDIAQSFSSVIREPREMKP